MNHRPSLGSMRRAAVSLTLAAGVCGGVFGGFCGGLSGGLFGGLCGGAALAASGAAQAPPVSQVVQVFQHRPIRFLPDSLWSPADTADRAQEHGRVILGRARLPEHYGPVRITARVRIDPVPKDEESVWDHWDRAGNVRLCRPGRPDLEVLKFVTAYGGRCDYELDVSQLAPLLQGECRFKGFIDTWVAPAWNLDFELEFRPDSTAAAPVWAESVLYDEVYTASDPGEAGRTVEVTVPPGLGRILLHDLVSGHCTDGRDADEFVPKDNVIQVDGRVVYRFRPWRDDCRRFRERNPYCRRWSDGSWSSDYSRSGWCPSDLVRPVEIDLTDHLPPGRHTLRFVVEQVRPADAQGNHGYWRLSSFLTGWKR